MDKKHIILLSLLLGLAIALLGLLLLILGRNGGETAVVAQPTFTAAPATAAPTAEPTPAPTEDPRLQLSSGPVERDVTALTLSSVTEEDLTLIRELTDLTLLDGRACENGSLLRAFSDQVDYPVLWTVALGDTRVDSETEELAVPSSVTTGAEIIAALDELPKVQTVDLRESGLGNGEVAVLRAAKPDLTYLYTVSVQGVRDDSDTKVLELDAGSITDWEGLAQEIALLPDLEKIVVNGALTAEQAAYLLEGAGNVSLSYSVSFQGRTIGSEDTLADFSDLPADQLGAIKATLAVLPNIREVNLDPKTGKSSWNLDEADQLQTFREGMLVHYTYSDKTFGTFSLADEVVSFNKKNLKRKVEALRLLLPYLRNVKRVDMENCNIDNETMAALRDEFPQTKLVWRVKVGAYTVRTDAWMIKFSSDTRKLSDKDTANLKYCREIKYLDLGHNSIHRMEFVSYMPDLEVCIMYDPISSLKGIETCSKLEYFECFSCGLKDLSPLSACTELKHLNVCYNHITDITPLYGLTKLERLWISRNKIPADQLKTFQELVPDCVVNTTVHNPTGDGWRQDENKAYVPRYVLLREQFRYGVTELRSYGDGWWDVKGTIHAGPMPTPTL